MLSSHSSPDRTVPADDDPADDIVYPSTGPFLLVYLACLAGDLRFTAGFEPSPAPRAKFKTVLFSN
jgi:hypothetical protein